MVVFVHREELVDATTKIALDDAEAAEAAVVTTKVLSGNNTPVLARHHVVITHDAKLILVVLLILGKEAIDPTAPTALNDSHRALLFLVLDEVLGRKLLKASRALQRPFYAQVAHVFLNAFCPQ